MFFYRNSRYEEDYFSFFMRKKGFEESVSRYGGFEVVFVKGGNKVEVIKPLPAPSAPVLDDEGVHHPELEAANEPAFEVLKITWNSPATERQLVKEWASIIEARWLTLKDYEEYEVEITSITPPSLRAPLYDELRKKGVNVADKQEVVLEFRACK